MEMIKYNKLKLGEAFCFSGNDLVYVRCKGGFRLGCGGKLLTPRDKNCLVIKYNP